MLASDDEGEGFRIEQLPEAVRKWIELLEAQKDHPIRAFFESLFNGACDDDSAVQGLPVPGPVYRFRREKRVAYVWCEGETWYVRPWQRTQGQVSNAVERVESFREALDVLARQPRPWWRFWQ